VFKTTLSLTRANIQVYEMIVRRKKLQISENSFQTDYTSGGQNLQQMCLWVKGVTAMTDGRGKYLTL
jgi:hypothetical protein